MADNLPAALGFFSLAAVVIVVAASFLASAADVIASRMGLGRLWVGSLLLAGATSLPELVTAVAAALGGSAELAAGNILGANMLNMSNLAILLAFLGGREVFRQVAPQQTWVAGSAILLTSVATLFVATKIDFKILAVSIPAIAILVAYVIISRYLRKFSLEVEESTEEVEEPSHSLMWGWTVFTLAAAGVFVAGPLLAISAESIAEATGIGSSFVGVLGLALVTTLPELTTTFAAFRMKGLRPGHSQHLRHQLIQHHSPGRGGPGIHGRLSVQLHGHQHHQRRAFRSSADGHRHMAAGAEAPPQAVLADRAQPTPVCGDLPHRSVRGLSAELGVEASISVGEVRESPIQTVSGIYYGP